jgi:predicted nucleic acid-binding protein
MIVLDTMVVLEPFKDEADSGVLKWLDTHDLDLWLTAITAAELQAGVEREASQPIRETMQTDVSVILHQAFVGRILPFDLEAALVYAEIAGKRQRADRRLRTFDFQIAAIARVHRAAVATRNRRDFEDCGVELIDPWSA